MITNADSVVSVCLPNLNTRPYLAERLQTIYNQTFSDWELLVCDNYSNDGAWQLFQAEARTQPRMRISQTPRDGMYSNWNNCIRQARGNYIYIATSDDTMAPDCLEKLVAALELHPECDLAHCPLRIITADGQSSIDWWSRESTFAQSCPGLLDRRHVRRAPYDGLLHLLGRSVYVSITQLLIRRSLFDRIGLFESRWASVGDFNWNMRAGLVAHTIHVPDTWGGWRVHARQATAAARLYSDEHRRKTDEMIEDALLRSHVLFSPLLQRKLEKRWLPRASDSRNFALRQQRGECSVARRLYLVRRLLFGSWAAREYTYSWLLHQEPMFPGSLPRIMRKWMESFGGGPAFVFVDGAA